MIENQSQTINFQRLDITNNNKILSFVKKKKIYRKSRFNNQFNWRTRRGK